MKKVSVGIYSLRIKQRRTEEYLRLGDFPVDFAGYIVSFLEELKNYAVLEEQSKILALRNYNIVGQNITGFLSVGDYGFEAPIVDRNDHRLKYTRVVDDAELIPIYFRVFVHPDLDRTFIAFERFGNTGVTKIFRDLFKRFSAELYSDFVFELNHYIPEDYIFRLVRDGEVKKLVLRRFTIPDNFEDYFDRDINVQDARVDMVVTAKRGRNLGINRRLIGEFFGPNNNARPGFYEIAGFEYNSVSVNVRLGNDQKTITMDRLQDLNAYFDLPNIDRGADGHPMEGEMDFETRGILTNLFREIYPEQEFDVR